MSYQNPNANEEYSIVDVVRALERLARITQLGFDQIEVRLAAITADARDNARRHES